MKKLLLPTLCMLACTVLFAQKEANQNPNFKISRARYMNMRDSLLSTQSTTVQNTYQAYDWMALRQERKDIRFLNRQQRRLNRSHYDYNYGYSPYNGYNQPYFNNSFYYNGNNSNGYYRSRYGSGSYYYNRYRPSFWWSFLF